MMLLRCIVRLQIEKHKRSDKGYIIMKKILIYTLLSIMMFSLCGCGSTDTDSYNKACRLFAEGQYYEAKVLYESLGNYSNSLMMVEKCYEQEIKEALQGRWKIELSLLGTTIVEFENDKVEVILESSNKEESVYSGTYWIDFETQSIYFHYDSVTSVAFGDTNSQSDISETNVEKKRFTYAYSSGELELTDWTAQYKAVKQESVQ